MTIRGRSVDAGRRFLGYTWREYPEVLNLRLDYGKDARVVL